MLGSGNLCLPWNRSQSSPCTVRMCWRISPHNRPDSEALHHEGCSADRSERRRSYDKQNDLYDVPDPLHVCILPKILTTTRVKRHKSNWWHLALARPEHSYADNLTG